MRMIYIIELIIAAIIFLIMLISMFTRKTKRLKIFLITMLLDAIIVSYVGVNYYKEEPDLELNGNQTLTLEVNSQFEEPGVKAKYHEKDVTNKVEKIGEVDTSKPGTYKITYRYAYLNSKIKEIARTIYVRDSNPPKIELKGKTEITLYTNEKYEEPGYTVEDNVDKDLAKQVKVEKKEISSKQYKLIYTVCDKSGNQATAERIINLKEPPASNNGTPQSNNGVIYLTFDDGPSLDITPKILDILKEENVKATFFILNYDTNREVLVKRIVSEGHTIAIHGYSHKYKQIYQSVDAYMENITKLQDKIRKSTGVTTNITRFPGGSSNTVSSFNPHIMTTLTKEVVNRGFRYYDWNITSGDAGGAKNRDEVYNNVTKSLSKNGRNVVLMHDFSNNHKTLDSLRSIIKYGKQKGYTFSKITQDTPMVKHHVNN